MSETKFTPGPWKVFRGTHGFQLLGIGDKNGEGVTDSYFNLWRGHDAEAEANAHLIAAAPDLYAALANMLAHAERSNWIAEPDDEDVAGAARAALQRARGETS